MASVRTTRKKKVALTADQWRQARVARVTLTLSASGSRHYRVTIAFPVLSVTGSFNNMQRILVELQYRGHEFAVMPEDEARLQREIDAALESPSIQKMEREAELRCVRRCLRGARRKYGERLLALAQRAEAASGGVGEAEFVEGGMVSADEVTTLYRLALVGRVMQS